MTPPLESPKTPSAPGAGRALGARLHAAKAASALLLPFFLSCLLPSSSGPDDSDFLVYLL